MIAKLMYIYLNNSKNNVCGICSNDDVYKELSSIQGILKAASHNVVEVC